MDGNFVAGPGIAPGSGGYEPPEILLLYPAIGMWIVYRKILKYQLFYIAL